MIAIEVLRRKKHMAPILDRCWQPITGGICYPQVTSAEPAHKLFFFGLVAYATVYEAAIAAGMSSSAAHYLARMQLGKCDLGEAVNTATEGVFSGCDSEAEQAYADQFHQRIAAAIERLQAGDEAIDDLMRELAESYRPVKLKD